jgi:hypothetical protein
MLPLAMTDPEPPGDDAEDQPEKRPGRLRRFGSGSGGVRRRLGGTVAVAAALVALGSAFFAYKQVNVAKTQNRAAEQESLVTLVSDITQQSGAALAGAPGPTDVSDASLADAYQGLTLVNDLPDAAPVDEYDLAEVFANREDYSDALKLYKLAAGGADTHFRVFALRGEAEVLYELAGPSLNSRASASRNTAGAEIKQAQTEIQLASTAYAGAEDVTPSMVDGSYAYTDLFDVLIEQPANCKRWGQELAAAEAEISSYPAALLDPSGPIRSLLEQARARMMKGGCAASETVPSEPFGPWADALLHVPGGAGRASLLRRLRRARPVATRRAG